LQNSIGISVGKALDLYLYLINHADYLCSLLTQSFSILSQW